jgi:putative transposase
MGHPVTSSVTYRLILSSNLLDAPSDTSMIKVLLPPVEFAQFRSKRVVRLLKNNGLRGSMGRVGSSSDNAAMESFFSLLQKNVLNTRRWNTREELRLAIVVWIETKYNRRRRQRGLKIITPVEFETIYTTANAG